MKVFTISDIHVDFEENLRWLNNLSCVDYQDDLLIVAGDVTHELSLLEKTLKSLRKRFSEILYVPGNHDLWVRYSNIKDSVEKLQLVKTIAADSGIRMEPLQLSFLSIIPLFGWYDYSFGQPCREMLENWTDYLACTWPENYAENSITQFFIAMNEPVVIKSDTTRFIISFSHFLPRIDIMPSYIPCDKRRLYPVLGTRLLEKQIRKLGSDIHVYGHSHVNNRVMKDSTLYINNAFGYPYETRIAAKELKCIFDFANYKPSTIY